MDDSATRIMLVDDHEPTRLEISGLISQEDDMVVVGDVETGEEAVSMASELEPSLIVMDLFMPGINGLEATRQILAENEYVRVLALSNYYDKQIESEIRRCGAKGFVNKSHAFEELLPAIRKVAAGGEYFSTND